MRELFFFNGGYQGASALFNAQMRKCIDKTYDYVAMHDQILNLAGVVYGNIHFLDKELFLYRQHGKNVTPHIVQNPKEKMRRTVKNRMIPVLDKFYFEGIKAFYSTHKTNMKHSDIKLFQEFLLLPSYNFWRRIMIILKRGYKVNNSTLYLLLKCFMRPFI